MDPRNSLRVAAREVRRQPINTTLNALGICALVALSLFGRLPAEVAGAGILALCGVWATVARRGR